MKHANPVQSTNGAPGYVGRVDRQRLQVAAPIRIILDRYPRPGSLPG